MEDSPSGRRSGEGEGETNTNFETVDVADVGVLTMEATVDVSGLDAEQRDALAQLADAYEDRFFQVVQDLRDGVGRVRPAATDSDSS